MIAAFGSLSTCAVLILSAAGLGFVARRIVVENRPIANGSVRLVPDGVEIARPGRATVVISPEDVLRGYELPNEDGVGLDLTRRRDIEILLPTGAALTGVALLSHLRASVAMRPFVGRLLSWMPLFWILMLLLTVSVLPVLFSYGAAVGFTGVAVLATSAVVAKRRFGAPKVHVGRDGLRVTGTWTQRFVPYRDIRGVQLFARGVLVLLDDGFVLQLVAPPTEQELLRVEIDKALAAHNARSGPGVGALARQGRPVRAWQEDLRRLADGTPGFRQQAWSREDLERVLEDASASVEQRVGAALALRADPGTRLRIRIAASASANEELRAALEACAAEDDAIDEAALEGITERAG